MQSDQDNCNDRAQTEV